MSDMPDPSKPALAIDCRSNDDIRVPVKALMKAENWLLERMPEGQKLIILIAEQHDLQSHVLFEHAVLQEHLKQFRANPKRSIAFGAEVEHNYLRKHTRVDIPDPDGRQGMALFNKSRQGWRSLEARQAVFDLCLRENISVGFNDMADVQLGNALYIDQSDPSTRSIVERHRPDLTGKNVRRSEPSSTSIGASGFDLSNIAIAENAMAHMERSGSSIYIQACGTSHVMGFTTRRYSYEGSLSALFRKHGHEVLCVSLSHETVEGTIPAEAREESDRSFKVSNMNYYRDDRIPYPEARSKIYRASSYKF